MKSLFMAVCLQLGETTEIRVLNFEGVRLWKLLDDRGVRVELGVPISQYRAIQKIQADAMKEKNKILEKVGTKNISLELALYDEIDGRIDMAIRAMFKPVQIRRLEQIAQHVEIAYNGIASAFADGKLRKLIGVNENQRTALREKASIYHNSAMKRIMELNSQYQKEVVDALSEPRAARVSELLGPFFQSQSPQVVLMNSIYEDLADEAREATKANSQVEVVWPTRNVPNFVNRGELIGLLHLQTVQIELGFSRSQREALEDFTQKIAAVYMAEKEKIVDQRDLNDPNVKADFTKKYKAFLAKQAEAYVPVLEELLLPAQMERLEQVGWWVEIEYLGIDGALISGSLGKELSVTEDEKQRLRQRTEKAKELLDLETNKTMNALQEQVINELSTRQKQTARELLGPYFAYKNWDVLAARQQDALKRLNGEVP